MLMIANGQNKRVKLQESKYLVFISVERHGAPQDRPTHIWSTNLNKDNWLEHLDSQPHMRAYHTIYKNHSQWILDSNVTITFLEYNLGEKLF